MPWNGCGRPRARRRSEPWPPCCPRAAEGAGDSTAAESLRLAERFLRVRGDWLRPDERALITGWLAAPIRLYEAVDVRRGVGVTVRGLPEGETTYLQDRMFSLSVGRLDLVCGRLLFDGAGPRILGNPIWVPREDRRELLGLLAGQPGMEELAEFFGPQPDAQLRNRDGHDVYDCQVVYEVPDGLRELAGTDGRTGAHGARSRTRRT